MKIVFSVFSVFLCLVFITSLSGCTYNVPKGYTNKHHSYEEVLSFARSIDPDAAVTNRPTDSQDQYSWKFREWDAVINGVSCHVASVAELIENKGFAEGSFVKVYYRIATDYDYVVLNNLLNEKYPDWSVDNDSRSRYHQNDKTIFVRLKLTEYRMLSDDELEQVWQTASQISEEYAKYSIDTKAGFSVPSPEKRFDEVSGEYYVRNESFTHITGFTPQEKEEFLQKYTDNWALVDTALPDGN